MIHMFWATHALQFYTQKDDKPFKVKVRIDSSEIRSMKLDLIVIRK